MVLGRTLMLRFAPALFLVFLVGAEGAWAADTKEEAKSRYNAGLSHYNLNEFAQALQEFKEAYRLYPDPVFLFNAGQCERQLDHYEEAIAFYRSFLRNQPKAPNRNDVKRKIEEMETALKTRPGPPSEPAQLDDPAQTGMTPPATVPPPAPISPTSAEEKPVAPAADSNQPTTEADTTMATPLEAKPIPLHVPLTAPPPPAPSNPVTRLDLNTSTPRPATPPVVYRRWWFWTATGIVLVGATTAVVLSLSSNPSGPPASALGGKKVF